MIKSSEIGNVVRFKKIEGSRLGTIKSIDLLQNRVMIEYDDNPVGRPIAAKMTKLFHINELERAVQDRLDVRIEFEDYDPSKPIISDIYYSVFDLRKAPLEVANKDVYLKARRIVLEADVEVMIKSGRSSVVYKTDGRIKEQGRIISSQASIANKIKGGNITMN